MPAQVEVSAMFLYQAVKKTRDFRALQDPGLENMTSHLK